jgi:hypothetical protein
MDDQPEYAKRPQQPQGMEEKSLSAALLQAANDAKEVGLGIVAAKLYDATNKPKDPPKGQ